MAIDTTTEIFLLRKAYKDVCCAFAVCQKNIRNFERFILPFKFYRIRAPSQIYILTTNITDTQFEQRRTCSSLRLSVSCEIYSIAHTYLNGVCIFKVERQ